MPWQHLTPFGRHVVTGMVGGRGGEKHVCVLVVVCGRVVMYSCVVLRYVPSWQYVSIDSHVSEHTRRCVCVGVVIFVMFVSYVVMYVLLSLSMMVLLLMFESLLTHMGNEAAHTHAMTAWRHI